MNRILTRCFRLVLVSLLSSSHVFGSVFLHESFKDESLGTLNYQMGGFGFRGYWGPVDWPEGFIPPDKGQAYFTVASGALSGTVTVYPNRVQMTQSVTNCEIKRKFASPLGIEGTTNYLRFLMRADYPAGSLWPSGKYFGLELRSGSSSRLYVGKGVNGSFAIGKSSQSGYVTAPETLVAGTTYLLVLKIESRAGYDRLILYVNPSSNTEPSTGTSREDFDVGQCDMLAMVSNFSMSLDEIVIADNFAEAINPGGAPVAPVISMISSSMVEGDIGTNDFPIVAQLSEAVPRTISVNWKTYTGTATPEVDYMPGSGVFTFPAGSTTATGVVSVIGDLQIEDSESFYVALSWPVNAQLGANSYCWILNDDASPPLLKIQNSNSLVYLSWSANRTNFLLETDTSPFFFSSTLLSNIQQSYYGGGFTNSPPFRLTTGAVFSFASVVHFEHVSPP